MRKLLIVYFIRSGITSRAQLLLGSISTAGAKCFALSPVDHPDLSSKQFPFVLDTGIEQLWLNATSAEVREKCIETFNFSSDIANWAFQY